jgi:glycerophosphoryl diester phosphodiesterase
MRAADYAFFDVPFTAFAHRGGATYEPNLYRENSMHAFKQAVALGYRYLETDVHATRDGVLLAFHDALLDRVTDHTGAVADLSYAEVSEARIHGIDPIP